MHWQIEILEQPFDALEQIRKCQAVLPMQHAGALSAFVGSMRDFNQQQKVKSMWLEHYPEMTQSYIESEAAKVCELYQLNYVYIAHRVGVIYPNDAIVVVAVWAGHRRDAMEANHYLVEQLKSKAPFWKKETFVDNKTHWVLKNTSGASLINK